MREKLPLKPNYKGPLPSTTLNTSLLIANFRCKSMKTFLQQHYIQSYFFVCATSPVQHRNEKCQIANQRYCSIKFFIYTRLWLDRLPFYFLEKICPGFEAASIPSGYQPPLGRAQIELRLGGSLYRQDGLRGRRWLRLHWRNLSTVSRLWSINLFDILNIVQGFSHNPEDALWQPEAELEHGKIACSWDRPRAWCKPRWWLVMHTPKDKTLNNFNF